MLVMVIVVALIAGGLVGIARGGRFRNLGLSSVRFAPALVVGVAIQAVARVVPSVGAAALVASYLVLLGFVIANIHLVGMGVVAVGIAMNATVVALNGGMPVRPDAVVEAGLAERDELATLDLGSKRHLERRSDRLTWMGDIVPVPFGAREVVSFGDLVLGVGIADVLVHLLRRNQRRLAAGSPDEPSEETEPQLLLTSLSVSGEFVHHESNANATESATGSSAGVAPLK